MKMNKESLNRDNSFWSFNVTSPGHALPMKDRSSSISFDVVIKLSIVNNLNLEGVLVNDFLAFFATTSCCFSGLYQYFMVTHLLYQNG